MSNEIEQIAQQNDMSIEFVTWFFNEKKANCGNVWFMMMAAMWEGWKGRSIEMDKLAAENAALKSYRDTLDEIKSSLVGGGHGHMAKADMQAQSAVLDVIFDAFDDIETPATDRIVAGIKADAIDEAAVELDRVDTVASTRVIGFKLREFAQQLREGADK
ncbi:TPA: hypothetical protein L7644_001280 [Klebsiella pneumoniae subsp. pneumoniae]|nr:hypothetical protein [Klebsiella pneumoniae subsp. pneumoniae]HBQ5925251.1 hypothetical protein [Klebsiella pneumoniae subsp. pneumoniae]HBQ5965806.1 hypothetical protein [Klebsiella pneumoniae subsp. pneumoniae]